MDKWLDISHEMRDRTHSSELLTTLPIPRQYGGQVIQRRVCNTYRGKYCQRMETRHGREKDKGKSKRRCV